jgi:hypothetical protein
VTVSYKLDGSWNPQSKSLLLVTRDALAALIEAHVGFKKVYDAVRPFTLQGAPALEFPCLMVEAMIKDPQLNTNGKYDDVMTFELHVLATAASPASAKSECIIATEATEKLLSNNARGDINTAAATYNYISYRDPTSGRIYWNASKFGPSRYSQAAPFQQDAAQVWGVRSISIFQATLTQLE